MRLLLDTSSFIWFVAGSGRLSGKAREIMEDFDNELVMSVASLWESSVSCQPHRGGIFAASDGMFMSAPSGRHICRIVRHVTVSPIGAAYL